MADIIESHVYAQQALMQAFKAIVQEANRQFKADLYSPLTITLGDEFQGVVRDVQTALRIIIFLEEIRIERGEQYNLRYVLLEGDIETSINTAIAYEMLGTGLTQARQALNRMKSETLRFQILIENTRTNTILNQAFIIFEVIRSAWNLERDHVLITAFLKNADYKIVAKRLNKNRSLMWKRAHNLQIESYNAIKKIIATVIQQDS